STGTSRCNGSGFAEIRPPTRPHAPGGARRRRRAGGVLRLVERPAEPVGTGRPGRRVGARSVADPLPVPPAVGRNPAQSVYAPGSRPSDGPGRQQVAAAWSRTRPTILRRSRTSTRSVGTAPDAARTTGRGST